jgi:hypothetical protein
MVLVRNYNTQLQKNEKTREAMKDLNLQVQNMEKRRRPNQQPFKIEEIKPNEKYESFVLNEEQESKLQSEQKPEELAKRNLLKLTDEANAMKIINELKTKRGDFLKYLNSAFPGIERDLKKNYKNVTVPFFC